MSNVDEEYTRCGWRKNRHGFACCFHRFMYCFHNGNLLRRLTTPSYRDRIRAGKDDKRCGPGSAGPLARQTLGVRYRRSRSNFKNTDVLYQFFLQPVFLKRFPLFIDGRCIGAGGFYSASVGYSGFFLFNRFRFRPRPLTGPTFHAIDGRRFG